MIVLKWITQNERTSQYALQKRCAAKGDNITVLDLRFCIPNKEIPFPKGIYTLEHLFAGFMRDHLNGDSMKLLIFLRWDVARGFYMSLIGTNRNGTGSV